MKIAYKIVLLVYMFSFYSCSEAQLKRKYLQKENIKGKVKSLTNFTSNVIKKGDEWLADEAAFKDYYRYIYNENGFLLEYIIYNNLDTSKVFRKRVYNYDKKAHLKEIIIKEPGPFKSEMIIDCKTNSKGQVLAWSSKSMTGSLSFLYDKNGNIIEKISKDFEDAYRIESYKYDKNDYLIEETLTDSDDEWKLTYSYDERGITTEINSYSNDTLEGVFTYEYLKFDKKGNWIERVEFENDKPKTISKRVIEYYEE